MAKLDGPLFSLNASGTMGDIVYSSWRGIKYARDKGKTYRNSEAQQEKRSAFAEAVKAYQNLSGEDKAKWRERAEETGYVGSGYNLFISTWLKGDAEDADISA